MGDAEFFPTISGFDLLGRGAVVWKLGEEKRAQRVSEGGSPTGDESLEKLGVFLGSSDVGFALIPEKSCGGEWDEGTDEVVEQDAGTVVRCGRPWDRWLGTERRNGAGQGTFDLVAPGSRKGEPFVAVTDPELLWGAAHPSVAKAVEDSDCDVVDSGSDEVFWNRVDARDEVFAVAAGFRFPDFDPVEVGLVIVVQGAERKSEWPA